VPVKAGAPRPLFETRLSPVGFQYYAVTADGQRFLVPTPQAIRLTLETATENEIFDDELPVLDAVIAEGPDSLATSAVSLVSATVRPLASF